MMKAVTDQETTIAKEKDASSIGNYFVKIGYEIRLKNNWSDPVVKNDIKRGLSKFFTTEEIDTYEDDKIIKYTVFIDDSKDNRKALKKNGLALRSVTKMARTVGYKIRYFEEYL